MNLLVLQALELHPVGQDEDRHVRVLYWRMEVRPLIWTRLQAIFCRCYSHVAEHTATSVIG